MSGFLISSSVTRFGKILPLFLKIKVFGSFKGFTQYLANVLNLLGQFLMLLAIFEPTWAMVCGIVQIWPILNK